MLGRTGQFSPIKFETLISLSRLEPKFDTFVGANCVRPFSLRAVEDASPYKFATAGAKHELHTNRYRDSVQGHAPAASPYTKLCSYMDIVA